MPVDGGDPGELEQTGDCQCHPPGRQPPRGVGRGLGDGRVIGNLVREGETKRESVSSVPELWLKHSWVD